MNAMFSTGLDQGSVHLLVQYFTSSPSSVINEIST
jgi:hypothetical protein